MNNEKHSEAFETTIRKIYPSVVFTGDGHYKPFSNLDAWLVWQAAIASRASKPEGVDAERIADAIEKALHLSSRNVRTFNGRWVIYDGQFNTLTLADAVIASLAHPAPQDVGFDKLEAALLRESNPFRDSENSGMLHISKVLEIVRAFQQATGGGDE